MARRKAEATPRAVEGFDEDFIDCLPTGHYFSEREAMYQLWKADEYGEPPSGADLRDHFWEYSEGCYLPRPNR